MMKSPRYKWLLSPFIAFFFVIYSCGCGNKSKDKNSETNKGLFADKVVETIDSTYLEKFLAQNPTYKDFRKKLFKFYTRRKFQLAWSDKGEFKPQAQMFINMVQNLSTEGVTPAKYNATSLRGLYNLVEEKGSSPQGTDMRRNLDIMLTGSYFKYSRDLWRGTVDPNEENLEWHVQRKKIKYGKTLDAILNDNSEDNPFVKNEPLHPEYNNLKSALSKYKDIEKKGGWAPISLTKKKLVKGDTLAEVALLKNRLVAGGDLLSPTKDTLFDSKLEDAVKRFQRRHGLKDDGVVSGKTLEELNVTVTERIQQIIINMERWRWVPQHFSENYMVVNIPEYKLHIYEKNKEAWNMNVIVGKAATFTPIFNDEMEYVVMSPYWNVPKSIVDNELLPLLKKNPVVLEKEDMEMYKESPKNPVNPYDVDWSNVTVENNKYKFRQRPGPKNALGRVKFLFPNEFDVYLHDTPSDNLFSQQDRNFSHGCIRLEEPQRLAEYVLKDDSDWPAEKINEQMHSGEEKYVKLKNKIPVYIVYFTAWVDPAGQVNFRNDVYGHDEKLAKAYFEK